MLELRPFQRRFIEGATAPGIDTAALSLPRGNGKSALAGHLVTRILTPSDPLFEPGTESVLCAASIEQARIVFRFARADMDESLYSITDAANRIGIKHKATGTALRVIGSNGKTAQGLVGCPWAICDEPGAWEINGGGMVHDAIQEAQGKPGSPLRALYIGTLAPMALGPGHWWYDMVAGGSVGTTHVMALQGDRERWDDLREVYRVNPLMRHFPDSRAKLRQRRDEALNDTRLKARFLSYRLNVPSADESQVLLTVDDWKRVLARPVAPPEGRPLVGIDLGGGRAWSAAVAVWPAGRVEAVAVCPGIPGIEDQERRDRVPSGTYGRLISQGKLIRADGLRVPPPAMLMRAIRDAWGSPRAIYCDWFRLGELKDSNPPCRVITRKMRSKAEAAGDIRSLRKLAKDGPLSCEPGSRGLLTASLAAAMVKPDDQGNSFLVKRDSNNQARDDVAVALTLAAGALDRMPKRRPPRLHLVA